jgi:hypothetical protein
MGPHQSGMSFKASYSVSYSLTEAAMKGPERPIHGLRQKRYALTCSPGKSLLRSSEAFAVSHYIGEGLMSA